MNNIISFENVSFSYQNQDSVLNSISLTIKQGEFISIIGPNGCGKSTLIKHFNAILVPTSGTISVFGNLTTDPSKTIDIRKNVSMVFQNPDNQIVATIVEEDVAFTLENLGVPSDKIRHQVDNALQLVNMLEYKKHSPYQLSGGQKQKVAIASAISIMPKCLILDEPTSMLDPISRRDILSLIIKICKQHKITVILVTHFMDEACLADRLMIINNGKILMDNTPKHIFSQPNKLKEIGLDLPQITQFSYELNKLGYNIDPSIISIDECVSALKFIIKQGVY